MLTVFPVSDTTTNSRFIKLWSEMISYTFQSFGVTMAISGTFLFKSTFHKKKLSLSCEIILQKFYVLVFYWINEVKHKSSTGILHIFVLPVGTSCEINYKSLISYFLTD